MSKYHVANFLINLKNTFISKKFIEFVALGLANTLINSAVSWLLERFLNIQQNTAAVLGYITALTISFFLNCVITFKSRPSFAKYVKFFTSYIPSFIIYFLITYITLNTMDLNQFLGTAIAAIAGGPVTFVIIKFYAFGKK